jgi:hypothetical protein
VSSSEHKTLRELHEAATPAPWIRLWESANVLGPLSEYLLGADQPLSTQQQRDIDLCVAMRNALPLYLDLEAAAYALVHDTADNALEWLAEAVETVHALSMPHETPT